MKIIDGGICAVEGVRACGVRYKRHGLALIAASGTAAGVFTKNKIKAGSIIVTAENIQNGRLDGIIANSGCANVYTGQKGVNDAKKMGAMLASFLGTDQSRIGVASTGMIDVPFDLNLIECLFDQAKQKLVKLRRRTPQQAGGA